MCKFLLTNASFRKSQYLVLSCETMNYIKSNNLNLKIKRFTPSGCYDKGVGKFEFVAKTQFLLQFKLCVNLTDR